MKQTKSIASFIENLPMDGSVGDCESALLVSNMDYTGGGGSNGGNCINTVNCEETTNTGECKNYNKACKDSENGGSCMSTSLAPPPPTQSGCGQVGGRNVQ